MVGDQQPWKIVQVEPCCNGVVEDAYAVTNLAQNNAKGMCNEALIVNNKNIDTRRGLRCHVAILVLSAQLRSTPTGLTSGNRSGDGWVPLSQGKHEGEPSLGLCDRLNRTRDNSQRQLPTDHDYAVSTREYQTDQSSLRTAPTAARSVFGKRQKQRQRQKQPHRFGGVDTVTPYQANSLIELVVAPFCAY
jgi:hypothetical protein